MTTIVQGQTEHEQRISIPADQAIDEFSVRASPLANLKMLQIAMETGREEIEQMQLAPVVSPGDAVALMTWVRTPSSLDWEALEHAEHEDGGWGG